MQLQLPLRRAVACQGKMPSYTTHVDPPAIREACITSSFQDGVVFRFALYTDRDRHKALWLPFSPWDEPQSCVCESEQVTAPCDAEYSFPLSRGRFVTKVARLQAKYTAF
ncbi:hypothetical protein CUC08_Gglean005059 [Alternaria sp. MG1]|nr:hypothetical protein CUC08_Gglean005059 [Alternaria sp. MG1]